MLISYTSTGQINHSYTLIGIKYHNFRIKGCVVVRRNLVGCYGKIEISNTIRQMGYRYARITANINRISVNILSKRMSGKTFCAHQNSTFHSNEPVNGTVGHQTNNFLPMYSIIQQSYTGNDLYYILRKMETITNIQYSPNFLPNTKEKLLKKRITLKHPGFTDGSIYHIRDMIEH